MGANISTLIDNTKLYYGYSHKSIRQSSIHKKKREHIKLRQSSRLANKHFHPYVLCIIDMQPESFSNSIIIIKDVVELVREAIAKKAFIIVAHYNRCGETHIDITNELVNYPYKHYVWANINDKSCKIKQALIERKVFTRKIQVCGVNTEYCVWETVNGLARKFHAPIKVIEKACNGTDLTVPIALNHMRTTYKNVEVI